MQPIQLAISEPFAAPPAGANWVVFGDSHSYATEEDTPRMLSRAVRYARKYGVYLVPGKFLQNGRIFFLQRPLEALAVAGRPLSVNLEELASLRMPVYQALCDETIENSGQLDSVARRIWGMFAG